MKNISEKAVQHGLERTVFGLLQSLWVELWGWCNLACAYCYADGGRPKFIDRLLSKENYIHILDEAQRMGVDSIGIPGAGEPFYSKNRELTMWFLRECASRGMFVTLFTTGQFITQKLAEELYGLPIELMIKGNSLNPDIQDQFVSNPALGRRGMRRGYGKKRNACLGLLMELGFNKPGFGRPSRMALVTSIMTSEDSGPSNYEEIVDILRFCRRNNVIFDCDTVLKRGRGACCGLSASDEEIKAKLLELQQVDRTEFPEYPQWELSQSYVGTVCDRYHHHMYINQYGEIRPCIGAMDVHLGNIREGQTLENAWNSTEMRVIRNRQYGGVCGNRCLNFAEGKCNSCLGRRAANLTNEFLREHGFVDTIGCWNHRPKGGDG